MKILFSEDESYYRNLGLTSSDKYTYEFDGMRKYNEVVNEIDCYDVFVCFMYTLPHNVCLTLKFRELGKRTILVMDGIYDYANSVKNPMITKYGVELYSPIIQDTLICVGSFPSKIVDPDIIVVDYLPARIITTKNSEEISNMGKRRVLITTANNCYFDREEFDAIVYLINLTVNLLEEKGVEYDFRIFDANLMQHISRQSTAENYNVVSEAFESILPRYSHVITTPSSILLTSMYHKKTVGMLNHRDTPPSIYASWIFSSKDSLNMGINSFLDSEPKRLELQDKILKTEISNNDINVAIEKSIEEFEVTQRDRYKLNYEVKMLMNMLNSSFNFNFEYFFRKVYLKFRSSQILKKIRSKVK